VVALVAALSLLLAAACSGGSSPSRTAGTTSDPSTTAVADATPTTAEPDTASSLPAGATAGLDDFDGDGQPDAICGTQDFGGGLTLRVPCDIKTSNEQPEGVALVKDSLFRLPGSTDVDLTGISGSLILSRDAGGAKIVIVTFNSDNLFETGSATIGSTDTLDATIRLINSKWPDSVVQVRGHTDATGSANANQSLSEQRAGNVKSYLTGHGLQNSGMTAVGFGSTRPVAQETKPDGSPSVEGRQLNRRVEIVLRLTK
jgi:outer membrane protein OmpA-like peptidoglycan-associated protein